MPGLERAVRSVRRQSVAALGLAILLGCLGWSADAGARDAMPDDPLAPYRWQSRILLLFTPRPDDALTKQQLQALSAERAGVRERDLLIVLVTGDGAHTLDGRNVGAGDALRARFAVPANRFSAVLVGKDGGAKLASDQPIAAQRLFSTIDRMPMRRREMGGAQGE